MSKAYKFNDKELEVLGKLHTAVEKIHEEGKSIETVTTLAAIEVATETMTMIDTIAVFLCAGLYGCEAENPEFKELRLRLEKHFNMKGI